MNISEFTTIDILRHGECEGGEIYRGQIDVVLNENGWQQMQRSVDFFGELSPWDHIITSPLKRCQQFASQLATHADISLQANAAFMEINFGDWDGKPIAEMWEKEPELAKSFMLSPETFSIPNGENMPDFQQRVLSGWKQAIEEYKGKHLLCVQHGGTIRIIMAHILNMPLSSMNQFHVPYANLCRIRIYHDETGDHAVLMFHNPVEAKP